ncbi:MAG: AI-2E family transporter [Deltaproteobacteria bacterium]|nr:AI-2E family transporter [Deltaproteobacteria bacterium]
MKYPLTIKIAAVIIIIGGIKLSAVFLTPVLLGMFFAIILAPLFYWLEKKNIPLWLALVIVITAIIGGGLGFSLIIASTINQFTNRLPFYTEQYQEITKTAVVYLKNLGFSLSKNTVPAILESKKFLGFASGFLQSLGNMISQLFLMWLVAIFILLEIKSIPGRIKNGFPDNPKALEQFNEISAKMLRYIGIKTLVSLFTGIIITLWTLVVGLDFPLFWGLLAFLMNYIPNIGSFLAAIPAVILALITHGSIGALLVGIGFLLTNLILGNFIEPRVMGHGTGLSPAVVFISMVFWGWVLGPVGMFLSVPLTAMVKIFLESRPQTRGIAYLLGDPSIKEKKSGA